MTAAGASQPRSLAIVLSVWLDLVCDPIYEKAGEPDGTKTAPKNWKAQMMGSITATQDREKDLTVVKATGTLSAKDFQNWMVAYYAGQVTGLILWDLTEADLSAVKDAEVEAIAGHTQQISAQRRGGKTAFVFDSTLEHGLRRILAAYVRIEDLPFDVLAFQNLKDAREWLGV